MRPLDEPVDQTPDEPTPDASIDESSAVAAEAPQTGADADAAEPTGIIRSAESAAAECAAPAQPETDEGAESDADVAEPTGADDAALFAAPTVDPQKLKQILEAALFASEEPLTIERMARLFAHGELDSEEGRAQLRAALDELAADAEGRGYELQRVASGYRYQVRQEYAEWVSRLWEEKPPRYSRALLETLALIAYKQPVTRGDIEDVRGVAVSQNIMRTLLERNWIRVVGEREVPGRPSLYGTTKAFLDYFNLSSLDKLPPLPEIRSLIETMVLDEAVPEAQPAPRAVQSHEEPADADSAGRIEAAEPVGDVTEGDTAEADRQATLTDAASVQGTQDDPPDPDESAEASHRESGE
jgi:segregation and condensation protein B